MLIPANRRQAGDTIVEVLIAIGIVGSLLVTAFQITARNTASMQNAQERGQATKLVQSQIEFLRNGNFKANDRCFDNAGVAIPNSEPAKCLVDSAGRPSTVIPNYTLSIIRLTPTQYTVTASWDAATNSGQAKVTMQYRP
jgi:type II secretory pathway pseudopilin PulG